MDVLMLLPDAALVVQLLLLVVTLVVVFVTKPIVFLKRDEQLLLETLSDKEVRNGPGYALRMPFVTKATKRCAVMLDELEFVIVTDTLSGIQRIEQGPQLLFTGAYETVGHKSQKLVLEKDEYIKVLDKKTGGLRVIHGPVVFAPSPTQTIPGGKQKAVNLKRQEWVRLTDSSTGSMRVERGEQLVFPQPMEVMEPKKAAFQLRKNEYVKLLDTATGDVRVEVGEQIVFPSPTEDTDNACVKAAVDIDDETAVLVVSKMTGQQRLVTDKGLYYPGPHDEILNVQKLIHVEPHEMAITRDISGSYTFHDGSAHGKGTTFFLQPHNELVTMHWSSGTSQADLEKRVVRNAKMPVHKVPVTKIDLRAQYAFFEFNVRTSDNVELLLEGTIFWQVKEVEKMIHATGDPKGDVWYHCRSSLIQAVSRVTLEVFMVEFNEIVQKAAKTDDKFYSERGVCVHNLEVTRYECADPKTSMVLQEIIQETTNRINQLQQQHSENDVMKEKMIGEIQIEKQRAELIQCQSDNERLRAVIEGEADGLRLAKSASTFLNVLSDSLPDAQSRFELFKFLEEQRVATKQTEHLATGNANLFLTPQDMALKLNMPKP